MLRDGKFVFQTCDADLFLVDVQSFADEHHQLLCGQVLLLDRYIKKSTVSGRYIRGQEFFDEKVAWLSLVGKDHFKKCYMLNDVCCMNPLFKDELYDRVLGFNF